MPWALLALVALNALVASWKTRLEATRRANLLVAAPAQAAGSAQAPRHDASVGEDLGAYWRHIPDARTQPLVIVSGMSQMYAINDPGPGDRIIAELVDDALRPEGLRAFGLAAPNLHNEEALLYLAATTAAPETRPDVFVYGLCFDKMRNVDMRGTLLDFVRERPAIQASLRRACDGREARFPMACAKIRSTLDGLTVVRVAAKSEEKKDESFEGKVRGHAARVLPMVDARKELNAAAQLAAYMARNEALGIKATTKRPVIRSRYELNRELLELMIEVAEARGVQMVFYVIPLNPAADNPYVADEYEAFKRWSEALAQKHGVPFANFEAVVPTEDWGLSNGEPDFKHFRGAGHRRTADAILARFAPVFRDVAAKKRRASP